MSINPEEVKIIDNDNLKYILVHLKDVDTKLKSEIGNYKNLEKLDLINFLNNNSNLNDLLPDNFFSLKKLKSLGLFISKNTRTLSDKFNNLPLESLHLTIQTNLHREQHKYNPNYGDLYNFILPNSILSKLLELTITNGLWKYIDKEKILNMPQLLRLNLSNNTIRELPELVKFKNLEHLNLEDNTLTALPELGELSELKFLNLNNNEFEEFPKEILHCNKIQNISLKFNYINQLPENIENLPELTYLNIESNLFKSNPTTTSNNLKIFSNVKNGFKEIQDKSGDLYERFSNLVSQYDDNPSTLVDRKYKLYLNDNILHNQTNPYLIRYEYYEGTPYPIINILKGTLLFTGRSNKSSFLSESYLHLYKLIDRPLLSDYYNKNSEGGVHSSFTYFYPYPFMSSIVSSKFTTMDCVVLTKDVKLLCLISPSPITRNIRNDPKNYGYENHKANYDKFLKSPTNNYDLDIRKKLVDGLKLNGYIAIAHMDSVSANMNDIVNTMRNSYKIVDYETTALFRSSCYNNIINDLYISNMSRCFRSRTFGTPEIVLIPLDIHNEELTPSRYETIYQTFNGKKNNTVNSEMFVFKHLFHSDGKKCIEVVKKIQTYIDTNSSYFGHSLQCYPLFTVLKRDVEVENNRYIVNLGENVEPSKISFLNSYSREPTSVCAFETFGFYKSLEILQKGGRDLSNIYTMDNINNVEHLTNSNKQNKYDLPVKEYKQVKNNNDGKEIYYSETKGIPILAIIKDITGGDLTNRRTINKNRKFRKTKKNKSIKRNRRITKRQKK